MPLLYNNASKRENEIMLRHAIKRDHELMACSEIKNRQSMQFFFILH